MPSTVTSQPKQRQDPKRGQTLANALQDHLTPNQLSEVFFSKHAELSAIQHLLPVP